MMTTDHPPALTKSIPPEPLAMTYCRVLEGLSEIGTQARDAIMVLASDHADPREDQRLKDMALADIDEALQALRHRIWIIRCARKMRRKAERRRSA